MSCKNAVKQPSKMVSERERGGGGEFIQLSEKNRGENVSRKRISVGDKRKRQRKNLLVTWSLKNFVKYWAATKRLPMFDLDLASFPTSFFLTLHFLFFFLLSLHLLSISIPLANCAENPALQSPCRHSLKGFYCFFFSSF